MAEVDAQTPDGVKSGGVRRAQAAQTEAALKRAGLAVFARHGYLNAKITDITSEANRSAGSFYTYFTGKEALLEALLTDLLAETDDQAAQTEHSDDFSDLAVVHWHVALYWNFLRRNQTVMIALRQAATVDEGFAQRVRELSRADLMHMADHLRVAQQHGVTLPGDPVVVAFAIVSLLRQFAELWLTWGDEDLGRPLGDAEAIETLTAFVAAGLGLRP
jgi:AcrR family transcriptional regulator